MTWKLTGNRYFVTGGTWLNSNYLGYNFPGGSQNLEFVVDSGSYWADEVEYNGEKNYFFLCDDSFRFFFIKKSDVAKIEYKGEHLYGNKEGN